MVRNYKRKTVRGLVYSKEDLAKAVDDVKSGKCGLRRASQIYKIPVPTIADHVRGRRGKKSESYGRGTTIPLEEEKMLVTGIKCLEKHGFGLTRKEVLRLVGQYVEENGIKNNFKSNTPGKDWFIGFRKRHRLSIKKPENVEIARRKACDPFIIYEYFKILKNTLEELKVPPGQIWNLDETSFCLDPSKSKIVGEIGVSATRTTSAPGRENTTVLLGCSAAGAKLPPLIVFRGKNVWDEWTSAHAYPGTTYAATKNGWMETDVFKNYFERCLLKSIGSERPVVIIYDGHSTHINLNLIEKAIKEQITIIKLPPHTSHLLQPLDLAVIKSFKTAWDEELVKWQRQNKAAKVPKKVFSTLLGKVWKELKPETISNGFKKGGIHPLDADIIPKSKFDPSALKRWEDQQSKSTVSQSATSNITPQFIEDPDDPEDPDPQVISGFFQTDDQPQPGTSSSSANLNISCENEDEGSTYKQIRPTSFEELFLQTIASTPVQKAKKTRIAQGAEVITHEDVVQRLKEKEEEEKNKKKKIDKSKMTKENKRGKKGTNFPKGKKKKIEEDYITTSESSASEFHSDESSDGEDVLSQIYMEEQFAKETETIVDPGSMRKVNDWVLVKFATKKTVKHFVGIIQSINTDNNPIVRFVRKMPNKKISIFQFPENEDISEVTDEDIVKLLPEPSLGRRGEVVFNIQFSSYNIQ